jgi:hypothetical protein
MNVLLLIALLLAVAVQAKEVSVLQVVFDGDLVKYEKGKLFLLVFFRYFIICFLVIFWMAVLLSMTFWIIPERWKGRGLPVFFCAINRFILFP